MSYLWLVIILTFLTPTRAHKLQQLCIFGNWQHLVQGSKESKKLVRWTRSSPREKSPHPWQAKNNFSPSPPLHNVPIPTTTHSGSICQSISIHYLNSLVPSTVSLCIPILGGRREKVVFDCQLCSPNSHFSLVVVEEYRPPKKQDSNQGRPQGRGAWAPLSSWPGITFINNWWKNLGSKR